MASLSAATRVAYNFLSCFDTITQRERDAVDFSLRIIATQYLEANTDLKDLTRNVFATTSDLIAQLYGEELRHIIKTLSRTAKPDTSADELFRNLLSCIYPADRVDIVSTLSEVDVLFARPLEELKWLVGSWSLGRRIASTKGTIGALNVEKRLMDLPIGIGLRDYINMIRPGCELIARPGETDYEAFITMVINPWMALGFWLDNDLRILEEDQAKLDTDYANYLNQQEHSAGDHDPHAHIRARVKQRMQVGTRSLHKDMSDTYH